MSDEFSNESFCTVIFDEFLLAGLGRDNVTRHLLKLLWYIHSKLPATRLHSLLKALQPTSQVIYAFMVCIKSFFNISTFFCAVIIKLSVFK